MFHLFGALWTHIFPIRYGQPVYILPRFEVRQFLHCIFLYRITETYLVPTMLRAISDHCRQQENHQSLSGFLTSLRYVGVAGAPIDKGSMERFRALMNPEKGLVAQIWGMTEVGVVFQERYCWSRRTGPARSCTCSCSLKDRISDMGSVGRILEPFYEAKLLEIDPEPDSASEERRKAIIEDGIPGELYVRGRLGSLFYGYLGGDYPTRETLEHQQGWFRTGDIVSVRDGRYYVQGRVKELIKVRGYVNLRKKSHHPFPNHWLSKLTRVIIHIR
jgi:acyl-CoA synthetase (AMP-forming)/AMP-acid ligase II